MPVAAIATPAQARQPLAVRPRWITDVHVLELVKPALAAKRVEDALAEIE